MEKIAGIGDNNPPEDIQEQSPFDKSKTLIEDLYNEASQWLDGEPVTTQKQADALAVLADSIKEAEKNAEKMRVAEVDPLNKAKAEIQARYNPLIKDKTGKTALARDCIKKALAPYLLELDRKQQEDAAAVQAEADEQARIAREAIQDSNDNLAEREKAEALVIAAKEMQKNATKDAKQKAHAKGSGRAMHLKTRTHVSIEDKREVWSWAWRDENMQSEVLIFLLSQAEKMVSNGTTKINGFKITHTKEL